jgi:PPOX class probable F420-dependent enzyme
VRLDEATCWERLRSSTHGVLGTVHGRRGVDVVPVVFVVHQGTIVVPIDTVKAKSGRRLQRLVNLEGDPRCTVLVDRYAEDWSELWWVRAHGRAVESGPTDAVRAALGGTFPAYRAAGSVASVVIVTVDDVTGWAATPD